MFKNAIIYTVTPGFKFNAEYLGRRPARPCSALEHRTDGFVAPCDLSTDGLVHSIAGHQVICWETEDKLLPDSVVRDVVAKRIEQIEEDQGRKVGRKEARDIKDRVTEELLPKAFVQHRRTIAVLAGKYFVINTSSAARADDMISAIVKALEVLPMRTIQTNVSPIHAMTGWVAEGEAPEGFSIDDHLELRSVNETASAIKYVNHSTDGPAIAQYIAAGKIAVKLGMTYNDRVSFVLDDKLHVKRIAILDIVREHQEEQERDLDKQSIFDADLMIDIGEITAVIDALVQSLGGLVNKDADLLSNLEQTAKDMHDESAAMGMKVTISTPGEGVIAQYGDNTDALYEAAKKAVIDEGRVSISFVQRHLRIGYNAAARLIERMEEDGIVGQMSGNGTRALLKAA